MEVERSSITQNGSGVENVVTDEKSRSHLTAGRLCTTYQ